MKKEIQSVINACIKETNELITIKITLEESEYVARKYKILDLIDESLQRLDERIVRLKNELKSLEN